MCCQVLLGKGVDESKILFLTLVAAPEGIHRVCRQFPRMKVGRQGALLLLSLLYSVCARALFLPCVGRACHMGGWLRSASLGFGSPGMHRGW